MKFKMLAAALVMGVLVGSPVQAQDANRVIQSDLVEVLSATNAALDAQSEFGRARAARDNEAAKDAAAKLLLATGGAAFWSRVLQIELAGNNSNPELARFAAELNELAARAFTSISPVVMDGDMAGLERILDESADTLTGLANAVRRLTLTMESG